VLAPWFPLTGLAGAAIKGAVAGAVGVGVPFALLGERRVQIIFGGRYFDWRCSVCGLVKTSSR